MAWAVGLLDEGSDFFDGAVLAGYVEADFFVVEADEIGGERILWAWECWGQRGEMRELGCLGKVASGLAIIDGVGVLIESFIYLLEEMDSLLHEPDLLCVSRRRRVR